MRSLIQKRLYILLLLLALSFRLQSAHWPVVRRQAGLVGLTAAEAEGRREEQDTVSAMASLRVNSLAGAAPEQANLVASLRGGTVSSIVGSTEQGALASLRALGTLEQHQQQQGSVSSLRVNSNTDQGMVGGSLPSLPAAVLSSRLSPLLVSSSPLTEQQ